MSTVIQCPYCHRDLWIAPKDSIWTEGGKGGSGQSSAGTGGPPAPANPAASVGVHPITPTAVVPPPAAGSFYEVFICKNCGYEREWLGKLKRWHGAVCFVCFKQRAPEAKP